jgi:hypothetical protein
VDANTMTVTLVLGVAKEQRVRELRDHFGETDHIEVFLWSPEQFVLLGRLDAEYFSITFAERWGAVPVPDGAQILVAPSSDKDRFGLPKYVIAGGALTTAPVSNGEALSRVLKSVLRVVAEHNEIKSSDAILRVGLWEGWFNFEKIGFADVARRVVEAMSSFR